jgi:hypothetical protein
MLTVQSPQGMFSTTRAIALNSRTQSFSVLDAVTEHEEIYFDTLLLVENKKLFWTWLDGWLKYIT